MKIPELLSPAGTPEAFCAALDGGADAIYFGVSGFNARANARNFTLDEMRRAIYLGHTVGVKSYVTLNTLLYDREYSLLLKTAEEVFRSGADAVIVADLGAAMQIKKYIPELPLHASTQCSAHNLEAGRVLSRMGFSRFVPARELSLEDIRHITKDSPIETEIFVHGALCVSHSGQCLFSSAVGGRSGNRGECAQPCRMKYRLVCTDGSRGEPREICNGYPLSLKDLTLCRHIRKIIDADVDSLKIEGRMKSPYYVREVTTVFRDLLDSQRDADEGELGRLREIFSRGGFTDGYFMSGAKSVSTVFSVSEMSGIRTSADKIAARQMSAGTALSQRSGDKPRSQKRAQSDTANQEDTESTFEFRTSRRRGIDAKLFLDAGEPMKMILTAQSDGESVSAASLGAIVRTAQNAPLSADSVRKNAAKFGNTLFFAKTLDIRLGENVFAAASELNQLRRDAVSELEEKLNEKYARRKTFTMETGKDAERISRKKAEAQSEKIRSARFLRMSQIDSSSAEYFGVRFLPFSEFSSPQRAGDAARVSNGIVIPPVIFDSEWNLAERVLENAQLAGIKYALVSNISQFGLAERYGFSALADFRLNIASCAAADAVRRIGRDCGIILSAETTLSQIRDICASFPNAAAIVYGRLPIMLTERCILRGNAAPSANCSICEGKSYRLTDRTSAEFPIVREWQHRNVILNSCPVWMADRMDAVFNTGIRHTHFIFTTESAADVDRVTDAYEARLGPSSRVRRIK